MQFTAEQRGQLLDFARAVVRSALSGQEPPMQPAGGAGEIFDQPAGCFVSLHALGSHRLRGCVGRIDATEPLGSALQSAAINVLEDPRFAGNPVTLLELPELSLEISVLSPLRPASGPTDFDLLNDGIYLTYGRRAGCFLPQVARETGWSREQLLDRLCTEKMGLPPQIWRDPTARLFVFSTVTVGPEPFVAADSINR
jgi:AmmeMemoRadiSam system protein A